MKIALILFIRAFEFKNFLTPNAGALAEIENLCLCKVEK